MPKIPELILAENTFLEKEKDLSYLRDEIQNTRNRLNKLEKELDEKLLPYKKAIMKAEEKQRRVLTPWISGDPSDKTSLCHSRYLVSKYSNSNLDPENFAWNYRVVWLRRPSFDKAKMYHPCLQWSIRKSMKYHMSLHGEQWLGDRSMSNEEAFKVADEILIENGWILTSKS